MALLVALLIHASVWAWLISWIVGGFSAKGTRLRFVSRSVQRYTQWVALVVYLISIPVDAYNRDWFWFGVSCLALLVVVDSIREFFKEDDDDIGKRGKKKLKKAWRKARENLRAPKVVPASGVA